MNREAFLARISAALGRQPGTVVGPVPGTVVGPVPTPPDAALVSPSTASLDTPADVAARFVAQIAVVGSTVLRAGARDAAGVAAAAARDLGASVCTDEHPVAVEAARASGLAAAPPDTAEVGITGAWRGVAETGTVVLRAEAGRLEGLLPPAHVVVLREADLRRNLVEVYADLAGALPSAVVQITGPSRTADIEMTLTTGVHGPGTVVVVLVADD